MKTFSRTGFFVLALMSVALLACGSDTSAPPAAFDTASTTQPLVQACEGAFTCSSSDRTVTFPITLSKSGSECRTSQNDVFTADNRWLSHDSQGKQNDVGSWSGDSRAFDLCDPVDCFHCTSQAVVAGNGNAADQGARCTGNTSCDDYGAGDCGTHEGCSLHGHAVYSFGMFDHYEDECQGSTPACSSHTTEEECRRQDCTWK